MVSFWFRLGVIRLIIAKEVAQAIVCAEAAGGDDFSATLPLSTGDHDDGTREEVAVAHKDIITIIAHAPPTIVGDEFRNLGVARPGFACHLDRGGILLQAATGVAQPRPMDTSVTI